MNNNKDLTRRRFLLSAGAMSGTTLLRLSGASLVAISGAACTARDQQAPFDVLGDSEAADLSAIAARIIPTTDTPGATEAGVIYFFDSALAGDMHDRLDDLRAGLVDLNSEIDGDIRFAGLAEQDQDELLGEIEGGPTFELIREMTIYGFFAMSDYGGNSDHIAWELIGFGGHNGGWQYPFGYYDAQVHGGGGDGE